MQVVLLIFIFAISKASVEHEVVGTREKDVVLQCLLNKSITLPEWQGPINYTTYNDLGSSIFFGNAKSVLENRLKWSDNQNDLVIHNVQKSDEGKYQCLNHGHGEYRINLVVIEPMEDVNTTRGLVSISGSGHAGAIIAVVIWIIICTIGIVVVKYCKFKFLANMGKHLHELNVSTVATVLSCYILIGWAIMVYKVMSECVEPPQRSIDVEQVLPLLDTDDLRVRHVFEEAMTSGKVEELFLRIMVVGCYNQGKTSLIKRLQGESAENVDPTDGIDVWENMCCTTEVGKWDKLDADQEKDVIMNNIVTAAKLHPLKNQKEGNGISRQNISEDTINDDPFLNRIDNFVNAPIASAVYTKPKVIPGQIEDKHETFATNTDDNNSQAIGEDCTEVPAIGDTSGQMLGDIGDYRIYNKFRDKFKNKCSEKSSQISLWDFGGQFVFYATHQLFLSRKAVYLLVFDLSKNLDDLVKDEDFCKKKSLNDYVNFWVTSIHSFVGSEDAANHEDHVSWLPCIILVGTHACNLDKKEIKKQFQKIRDNLFVKELQQHIYETDLYVDNISDPDAVFEKLRMEIENIAKEKINVETIPISWNALELALYKIKDVPIITFSHVQDINNLLEYPIKELDLTLFLIYCHEKGRLFYIEGGDHVVLKPQFLIDAFKSIITSKNFCLKTKHKTLPQFWRDLFDNAKLTPKSVEDMWKEGLKNKITEEPCHNEEVLKLFLQYKDTIFEFLEFQRIISKVSNQSVYLVPSFLKADDKETVDGFTKDKFSTRISVVFEFQYSTIVPTVFHRIIAAALGKWSPAHYKDKRLVFENVAAFKIDIEKDLVGIIKMDEKLMQLTVYSHKDNISSVHVSSFRRFVAKCINHEFRKMKKTQTKENKKPFMLKFSCMHYHVDSHNFSNSKSKRNVSDVWDIENHRHITVSIPCLDSVGRYDVSVSDAFLQWYQGKLNFTQLPVIELQDKDLSMLALTICKNVKNVIHELGKQLGLAEDELKYDSNDDSALLVYKMLLKWKETEEKKHHRALFHGLLRAIDICKKMTVDWDEIRNFLDERTNEPLLQTNNEEIEMDPEHKNGVVAPYETVAKTGNLHQAMAGQQDRKHNLEEPCSELDVEEVTNCIGNELEHLGPYLGLSAVEIDRIKSDHNSKSRNQIREMLLHWRRNKQKKHEMASLSSLFGILRDVESAKIDWDKLNEKFGLDYNNDSEQSKTSGLQESVNFIRINTLIVHHGTEVLLKTFYFFKPKKDVKDFLSSLRTQFKFMGIRHFLTKLQYAKLTEPNPNPDNYDFILLFTLLRNFFPSISSPSNGWNTNPADDDVSLSADMLRLRNFRNMIAHATKAQLNETEFNDLWSQVTKILKRMMEQVIESDEERSRMLRKMDELQDRILDVMDQKQRHLKISKASLDDESNKVLYEIESLKPKNEDIKITEQQEGLQQASIIRCLHAYIEQVGAIIQGPDVRGTVFRVGSRYVMTTYHVIKLIVDLSDRDQTYHQVLTSDAVCINFNRSPTQHSGTEYRLTDFLFFDELLDVAILELANFQTNIQPFRLCRSMPHIESVSLIRYGQPHDPEKHIDLMCSIVHQESEIIHSAHAAMHKNVFIINNPTLAFDFNASGSPLLTNTNPGSIEVVGLLTRSSENTDRFHVATRMDKVYCAVIKYDQKLANDLYGTY